MKALLAALLLTLSLSTPAWATRYWVATTGSDANPCASIDGDADPGVYKLTPSSGAACLTVAGDRLTIKNGTYNSAQIFEPTITVANGTAGNPTIIEGVYTVGCAMTSTCATILNVNNSAIKIVDASYITVRGMEVNGSAQTGTDSCIYFSGTGSQNVVEDVVVHHCGGNSIFTAPNQNFATLRRVNSHNPGQVFADPRGHGCYLEGDDNLIEYSWFHDAINSTTVTCQIYDSSNPNTTDRNVIRYSRFEGAATSDALVLTGADNQVYNNLFINSVRGITHYAGTSGNCNSGLKFYNNTVSSNTLAGYIGLFGSCPNGTVDASNNIVVGNSNPLDFQNGWTNTGVTNKTTGTITDCTVSTTDFTHKVGSSCINAGTAKAGFSFNGAAPEIGRYETSTYASASINATFLDVTIGQNVAANSPVVPTSAGWSAACSGGANCGTPVVSAANLLGGSSNVVRLTLTGLGGAGVCEVAAQVWTVTYNSATGATTDAFGQEIVSFTTSPATNACGVAPATITHDASSNSGAKANQSATSGYSHTAGTLTNGIAIIRVSSQDSFPGTISEVTYNGAAATQCPTNSPLAYADVGKNVISLWYYKSPPAGASAVVATFSEVMNSHIVSVSTYSNVDQTTPLGTCANATDFDFLAPSEARVTVTSAVGELVVAVAAFNSGTTNTPTTTNTSRGLILASGNHSHCALEAAGAATVDMTCTETGGNLNGIIGVSLKPASDSPPATGTFTQKRHQFMEARYVPGTTTTQLIGAQQAAINVAIGQSFGWKVQMDCTAANCDPLGRRVHASHNGGAFLALTDDCSFMQLCFIGAAAAAHPDVLNGTVTPCLSGALGVVPGSTQRTADAVPVVDLAQNECTPDIYVMKLGPLAVLTDTYDLKLYNQTGEALDVYDPVGGSRITVAAGISAPTNPHFSGPTSNTLAALLWAPVISNLAGTNIYRSTTSGVYSEVPTYQVSVAASLAAHSPPTQKLLQLPVAGTYYFTTKSYDLDGNLSAASSEVSKTVTGMSARAARQ